MRYLLILLCLALSFLVNGQIFQTVGDWNTTSNWSTGVVPSGPTTNVTISASPTISSANTIGAVTDGNVVTYTITSSGSLAVGASGTPQDMTFNNNGSIIIASGGKLEIWGNLIAKNSLTLTVTGTLIVHGDIQMQNGAALTVSGGGNVYVYGSVIGQQNTHLTATLGGIMSITGALSLGSGTSSISTLLGGTISAGSCSCTGCGPLAGCSSVLPITLLFFTATLVDQSVKLNWATASEINFDHFILEKSTDGIHFLEGVQIPGYGNSNTRRDYSYQDDEPFVGRSYYRLTSIDFDGYKETFNQNIVAVRVTAQRDIQVFPNPVIDGSVKVKSNFDVQSDSEIIIYNSVGILLAKYAVTSNEMNLFMPPGANGFLLIKFTSSGFSVVKRLLVVN